MDICFTINLGVLSSVLCGLRSLDAAVRGQTETQRQEIQHHYFGSSENFQPPGTLIFINLLKATILTLKPSSIQKPASSSAIHPIQIFQQNRNTTMHINKQVDQNHTKSIDTPKLTTGHFVALQRKEIHFHLPEHKHKFPWPGNLEKPIVQPHP